MRFRLRLEPSLHDCFGGRTVRDSARCFSVLLLRWQWGEQEWVESSLSDTGVVCSENLLNRTALPTTSSAHRGLWSENRHSHSTSSCSSAQCVPSLKQTSCSFAGFVLSCVVIVRCVLPGCAAPACPPFLPQPRASPPMLRVPAKSTLGGSYHFSCSM